MEEQDWLARRFDENRGRLRKVAYRMLGSATEADDAVQEAWLRLSRSDPGTIDNLPGWLTTVVARISLDMLRSRKRRKLESLDTLSPAQIADSRIGDPERETMLAESIGPALLIVLDYLSPVERVAFVLHDMFGMPFDQIGPIIGRSQVAARQLASRARRRIRGSATADPGTASAPERRPRAGKNNAAGVDPADERKIVDAFLAAAREGEFEQLLSLLDPECVLRSDDYAALMGSPPRIDGGRNVAEFFNGASSGAVRTTINGAPGAAWAPNGKVRVAFSFSYRSGRIVDIELIADRKRLQQLGVVLLDT